MENKGSFFLKLTGTVLGITLVISLIVLLIGFILQWHESTQFSNGFFVAGRFLSFWDSFLFQVVLHSAGTST